MSVFLMRPMPLTWQRLKPITEVSSNWRTNDFCAPPFDYSTCKTPLTLSYPRLGFHPQAIWKVPNYRGGRDIFGERKAGASGYEEDYDSDTEDEDRSLDLFVRFVHTIFKKVSRRARKAAKSILPPTISPQLQVGFSVNGVLILASLWILKAFLQVVCTLGSVVFVSILLLRGIWSAATYIKINGNRSLRGPDDDNSWSGAQPVT
ncbi:protein SHORT HYPOCOTYL IN WHITE LIGHT 1 isoform X2 [Cryptomeria japonica]|uniref:protein SHORT HYPOCOTYL IN WHITE LIGHT 1 isoform X2 n=1 Tax=Cryptomeria japonica TaxID=3369 RepID=UPI0025AD881C|nr:protein SHORT HYPOCOTYL IN WHITE LIGHT 1 isoform X2 [Cryptomeria japonica]